MTKKKRVACFFTAGYTELNSMKLFMRKINNNIEYIQLCPNGPRKSKNAIKSRQIGAINPMQSGLTNQALIDFVLNYIEKPAFIREEYDGILIEDDKDDRFLAIQSDGTAAIDEKAWADHKRYVEEHIHKKYSDIPVLFFWAAPEVEAWFIADWDNSFGHIYENHLSSAQNSYFSTVFRKHVQENIVTKRYAGCLESYGYFDGKYKKISTEIQGALEELDFLKDYAGEEKHETIRYSKRLQGANMLENIDPQNVLRNCTYFFKSGLLALKSL